MATGALGITAFGAAMLGGSAREAPPPIAAPPRPPPRPVAAPPVEAPAPEPPPPPAPPVFRVNSRHCLVGDRNGDGAAEVTVLLGSGARGRQHAPALVDGATGEILWRGVSSGGQSEVYLLCLGERWIGVLDDAAFALRLIDLDAPEREVRHVLTDEVFYWGVTDRCLKLRLDDGARPSFSLEDGAERSCSAPTDRRTHITYTGEQGIISTLRRGARASAGDMDYVLSARRRGTAFLEVTARRRGRQLYEVPLRFVPVGGEAIGRLAMVPTPHVLVVFGQERGRGIQRTFHAVGLDAEAGTERFATPIESSGLREVFWNGRYVTAGLTGAVVAIDPADGRIAWSVGGRRSVHGRRARRARLTPR